LADRQPIDLTQYLIEAWSVRVAMPAPTGGDPQPLDDGKRLVPLQTPDNASKRAREPADVIVEWEIFWSWRGRGRHVQNDTAV
jgi:hypothetical protein